MAHLRFLWRPRDLGTNLAHCQAGCVSFLYKTKGAKLLQALAGPHKAISSPSFSLPFVVGGARGKPLLSPGPLGISSFYFSDSLAIRVLTKGFRAKKARIAAAVSKMAAI